MSEKRFIVETVEITDCDTDESRITKVITDTNELYSYDDLYELCDDLNKLAEENEQLKKEHKIAIDEMITDYKNLEKENEQLRQKSKHCVYVDVDNANGCMNCKYDKGSICSKMNCGTHDYLEGVSECGLKYWEYKDE